MLSKLMYFWNIVQQLSGEDAYERYLARFNEYQAKHQKLHAHEIDSLPLTRQAFFKQWQDNNWKGIKRCC